MKNEKKTGSVGRVVLIFFETHSQYLFMLHYLTRIHNLKKIVTIQKNTRGANEQEKENKI